MTSQHLSRVLNKKLSENVLEFSDLKLDLGIIQIYTLYILYLFYESPLSSSWKGLLGL